MGNNGAYLFLGSLYPFDDAQDLVELGVPRLALFLAGAPLVVAFLYLFGSFLLPDTPPALAALGLTLTGSLHGGEGYFLSILSKKHGRLFTSPSLAPTRALLGGDNTEARQDLAGEFCRHRIELD